MINNKKSINLEKVVLFLFLLFPLINISLYYNNDAWFLLNHGRYVIENGIPYIEPFTIHNDFEFVMQQWLFSVIFWLIYSHLGKLGVIAFFYLIGLIIIFVTYKLCMILSDNCFIMSILTSLISMLLTLNAVVTRPQSFTLLIILIELLCLEKYAQKQNWKHLIPLPFLSIIEINCHASMWFMMFAFALPYLINSFKINIGIIKSQGYKKLPLFICTAIMFVVGFINPYGIDAVTYVFRSYGYKSINSLVTEMKPTSFSYIYGQILFLVLIVIVLIFIFNKKGKTELRFVLLFFGTLILALMNLKGVVYFFIGGVLPIAYFLKNQKDKIKLNFSDNKGKRLGKFLLVFICSFYILCISTSFIKYNPEEDTPKISEAVEYLLSQEKAEDITLYVGYNDRGYTEFYGIKSYLDPRAEVFLKSNNKKEDIFEEYVSLQCGELYYQEFLDKYDFTHILADSTDILYTYLAEDKNYSIMYEDDDCRLFVPVN